MPARSGLALTIGFAAEHVRESSPLVHCVAPLGATPFVADVVYGVGARSVVTGTARAIHVGRSTQVWEIRIENEAGKLVCISRLTLAVIPAA